MSAPAAVTAVREPSPDISWPRDRRTRWMAAALILLAIVAMSPALAGEFIWDDNDYVTENPTLRSWRGLTEIWVNPSASPQYYPLVFTTFWIEYRLYGLHPLGYHAINIALHAAAAFLAWMALARLRVPGAWWAAALFAVHPVHVESVAWVTERKNVLSTVLYLVALLLFLRSEDDSRTGRASQRARSWWLSLLCFAAALFCKTVTCSLPAALILMRLWQRRAVDRVFLVRLAPFFALGLALGLFTADQEFQGGVKGPEFDIIWPARVIIACRALLFYAGKLAWPDPVTFFYPRWVIDVENAWQWLPVVVVFAIGLALVALWRMGHVRGPFVAASFFAGTLFPALGFFDVYPFRYSYVADHFQYLASLGLFALVCGGIATLARKFGVPSKAQLLAIPVIVVLATLSFRESRNYKDLETLWRATLAENPAAFNVHVELGNLLVRRGELERALEHFQQSFELAPTMHEGPYNAGNVLTRLSDAASQRAELADSERDEEGAARERARAAELDEQAILWFRHALAVRPDHAPGHNNLAIRLMRRGRATDAMHHFRRAFELEPTHWASRHTYSRLLAERGEIEQAMEQLELVLPVTPRDEPRPARDLGRLLQRLNRLDEAERAYERALRARPRDVLTLTELADLLVQNGKVSRARRLLEQELVAQPRQPRLQRALAMLPPSSDDAR